MAYGNAEGPAAVKAVRLQRNAEALARAQEALSREEVLSDGERLAVLAQYTGVGGLVEVDDEKYGAMAALQQSRAALGQYLTPLEVARFFAEALAIAGGAVYDNCAGAGRLFAYLPPSVRVVGIELQEEAFTVLRAAYQRWPGGADLIHGDCLEYRTRDAFEYALGNPPFGLTWSVEETANLQCASSHKGHVLSLEAATELQVRAVKAGGFIGLVVPEAALERDDLRRWREWMLAQCVEMARVALPRSGDEDPGTRWPCVAWLLQKRPAMPPGGHPVHYPEFRAAPRSFEELNTTTLQAEGHPLVPAGGATLRVGPGRQAGVHTRAVSALQGSRNPLESAVALEVEAGRAAQRGAGASHGFGGAGSGPWRLRHRGGRVLVHDVRERDVRRH
jgi:predicted RNA methylase